MLSRYFYLLCIAGPRWTMELPAYEPCQGTADHSQDGLVGPPLSRDVACAVRSSVPSQAEVDARQGVVE